MSNTNSLLRPLPGFTNWAYDIHEVAPGVDQVDLYRDDILRFSSPSTVLPEDKVPQILIDAASRMEFDIQRRFSRRLYGFDAVRAVKGIFSDMVNENIRRFLAQYAVSLKHIEVPDCGIRRIDVFNFLGILEKEEMQILEVSSYREVSDQTVIECGEKWRVDDMRTPTPCSLRNNLASVRSLLQNQGREYNHNLIYSFVFDSRDVVDYGTGNLNSTGD